jgi:hypothetical protein
VWGRARRPASGGSDEHFLERVSKLVADVLATSNKVVRFARTEEEGRALIAAQEAIPDLKNM